MQVVKESSGGVRYIGSMQATQLVEKPAIYGAKSGGRRDAALPQKPLYFSGGEIRVYEEARFLADKGFMGFKSIAAASCAAVLPYNTPIKWSSRSLIPSHDSLPLVRDTHRTYPLRRQSRPPKRLLNRLILSLPNLLRLLLYPARLRIIQLESPSPY
jgi:hypothetical protein